MATIAELAVKISANIKDFQDKMKAMPKDINKMAADAEKGFGPIMNSIGTGLKVMGAAAATGFSAAIVGSLKGASSLENYRNTLNVVTKDQQKAAQMMAWAVEFANKTPFETDSVVQATVRLQAYGLEAQKVLPAIGDMAGVMNKDLIDAVEAVADAQTGELERLKEFGITKGMIVEQGNKIMRGVQLVNNQGQIVDQENFNKALFSLMEERFKGGMEIQASSFSGLMSTLKGVFSTTLATMAGISATGEIKIGGLFDNVKKKMQLVIDKLNEWQNNGQLQAWADRAQESLIAFWNVGEKVFLALVNFGRFIADHWGVIEPILAGVLAGFLAFKTVIMIINAAKIAMAAFNLIMSANPIAMVVLAIGALVTAGVYLYRNWDTVSAKMRAVWTVIKLGADKMAIGIGKAWNDAKSWVYEHIQSMLDAIAPLIDWLPGAVTRGFDNLRVGVAQKVTDTQNSLDDLAQKGADTETRMRAALDGVSGAFAKTSDKSKATTQGMTQDFWQLNSQVGQQTDNINRNLGGTGAALDGLSSKAKDTRTAFEKVMDSLGLQSDVLRAKFDLVIANLGNTATEADKLTATLDFQKGEMELVTARVTSLQAEYDKLTKAKKQGTDEGLKLLAQLTQEKTAQAELEKQIKETTKALQGQTFQSLLRSSDRDKVYSGAIGTVLEGLIGSTGKGWDQLSNTDIADWIATAPSVTLPQFATGGIVPGLIGRPTLAVVHGGEKVLTPGQQAGTVSNYFNVRIDAKDLEGIRTIKEFFAHIRQASRSGAGA